MPTLATPTRAERWRFGILLFVAALGLFAATLAPSVTLWDAGEFLAASKILGIPHPPGTPLWVILAHAWGTLVPFGRWENRIILMTAVASAGATACLGLMVWEALRRVPVLGEAGLPAWLVPVGAGGAALAGAFTFTNWQNSNETEVYAVAMLVIGIVTWLCAVWRERRGTPQADRTLLVILYLAGLSIGNHLLALLVGPAVVAFLWLVGETEPLKEGADRMRERATTAVVAGTWILLIGLGLGSTALSVLGGLCFLAAALWAMTHGRVSFTLVALTVALVGITSYLVLFLRSPQHPILNEAAPDNWHSLLDVIRRKQYPPRGPLDDPTVQHGAGNPGRSLRIIGLQLVNYFQYFYWQWGMGVTAWALKIPIVAAYAFLGMLGFTAHKRADRPSWGMFGVLFLTTGLGLMAYMNFKPGFSLGYNWYPDFANHEVRERDYFFVVSFVVWGIWAGMGLVVLAANAWRRVEGGLRPLVTGGALALCLLPVATNWAAATRARPPIAMLGHDFAYDALNSVGPYGILITYGDNDTFPLWYAQEVEGIRPDVTVVCMALAQTDWYLRQLRDNPTRPFVDSASAPIWRGHAGPRPTWPLHALDDATVAATAGVLHPIRQNTPIQLGPITHMIPAGAVLAPNDVGLLAIFQQNLGRRPIAWLNSTGRNFLGLDPYIVQQGIANLVSPTLPDTNDPRYASRGLNGVLLDIPLTRRLVDSTYRWAGLDQMEARDTLDPAGEGLVDNLAQPAIILAVSADTRGETAEAIKYLEFATHLRPEPQLRSALAALRQRQLMERSTRAPVPSNGR